MCISFSVAKQHQQTITKAFHIHNILSGSNNMSREVCVSSAAMYQSMFFGESYLLTKQNVLISALDMYIWFQRQSLTHINSSRK